MSEKDYLDVIKIFEKYNDTHAILLSIGTKEGGPMKILTNINIDIFDEFCNHIKNNMFIYKYNNYNPN